MTTKAPSPTNAGDNDIYQYYKIPPTAGAGSTAIAMKAKKNSYQADVFAAIGGLTATPDAPKDASLYSKKKALTEGRVANVILILKSLTRNGSPGRSIVSVPVTKIEEVLKTNGILTNKQVGPKNRIIEDVRPCTR
jgi:hypothetical protein